MASVGCSAARSARRRHRSPAASLYRRRARRAASASTSTSRTARWCRSSRARPRPSGCSRSRTRRPRRRPPREPDDALAAALLEHALPRRRLPAPLRPALALLPRQVPLRDAARAAAAARRADRGGRRRACAGRRRGSPAPELGAVALAAAASLESGLPFLIVRKAAKEYGTANRIEGAVRGGRMRLPRRGRRHIRRRAARGGRGAARGGPRGAHGGLRRRPRGGRSGRARPSRRPAAPALSGRRAARSRKVPQNRMVEPNTGSLLGSGAVVRNATGGEAVTKQEFVAEVAERSQLDDARRRQGVDAFLETITDTLKSGGDVSLHRLRQVHDAAARSAHGRQSAQPDGEGRDPGCARAEVLGRQPAQAAVKRLGVRRAPPPRIVRGPPIAALAASARLVVALSGRRSQARRSRGDALRRPARRGRRAEAEPARRRARPAARAAARRAARRASRAAADASARFCCGIVDAVAPHAVAVKPQSAFFEALGADGVRAFERGVRVRARGRAARDRRRQARRHRLDRARLRRGVHRGDGRSPTRSPSTRTSARDSLEPFLDACRRARRRASSASSRRRTPAAPTSRTSTLADGRMLWQHVARLVAEWGEDLVGERGLSCVGAVVGATLPARGRRGAAAAAAVGRSCCRASARRAARPADVGAAFASGPGERARLRVALGHLRVPRGGGDWRAAAGAEAERLAREVWAASAAAA